MQSASDQSRGHFVRVTWIRVYRDDFWNDFSMRLLIIIHSSVKFLMSFCILLINYSRQVLMPLASDYVAFLAVLGVVATLHAHTSFRMHLWHRGPLLHLPRKTEARSYQMVVPSRWTKSLSVPRRYWRHKCRGVLIC